MTKAERALIEAALRNDIWVMPRCNCEKCNLARAVKRVQAERRKKP